MGDRGSQRRRNYLRLLAVQLEKVYDAVHRFLAWITGRLGKPMVAEIYHATPVDGGVAVKGRVLLSRKTREPSVDDPPFVNLVQMLKRWATPERPRSLVRLSVGGRPVEKRADEEGYFEACIEAAECVDRELLVELPESEVSEEARHPLTDIGDAPRVLILSDIDDTVLVTHAARTLRMIATTLFGNALTRQLFPGSPELYQALRDGPEPGGDERNPFVFVTSSPYNLHGMLHLIFERHGLPLGPFFMTDWGLDGDRWFKKGHGEHKHEAIEEALNWFPDIPVLLIGDSGQHDTSIYVETALQYPDRIRQILIRDVSGPERLAELNRKVDRLEPTGIPFSFFRDCDEAAEILTEGEWISVEQARTVRAALSRGKHSFP